MTTAKTRAGSRTIVGVLQILTWIGVVVYLILFGYYGGGKTALIMAPVVVLAGGFMHAVLEGLIAIFDIADNTAATAESVEDMSTTQHAAAIKRMPASVPQGGDDRMKRAIKPSL